MPFLLPFLKMKKNFFIIGAVCIFLKNKSENLDEQNEKKNTGNPIKSQ